MARHRGQLPVRNRERLPLRRSGCPLARRNGQQYDCKGSPVSTHGGDQESAHRSSGASPPRSDACLHRVCEPVQSLAFGGKTEERNVGLHHEQLEGIPHHIVNLARGSIRPDDAYRSRG